MPIHSIILFQRKYHSHLFFSILYVKYSFLFAIEHYVHQSHYVDLLSTAKTVGKQVLKTAKVLSLSLTNFRVIYIYCLPGLVSYHQKISLNSQSLKTLQKFLCHHGLCRTPTTTYNSFNPPVFFVPFRA